MKIQVCKYCGSPRVFQDASYNINEDGYSTYDDVTCEGCGAEGSFILVEVEVDEDFDLIDGMFDLRTLS